MGIDLARHCTFTARLDCHYLLHTPEAIGPGTALAVALHGFGSNPEDMLDLTLNLLGDAHAVASIQGPNQFFLSEKAGQVGYGWGASRNTASSIRLHHEMAGHVLDQAGRECGIPPERRILVGFSQPVSLNYRFAATCPDSVRGVIGLCGGVPGNWEDGPFGQVSAALFHVSRKSDEYYALETARRFPERLSLRARDVEFHLLDGGHRFPSKAGPLARTWLRRITAAPAALSV
jgi:predicted esterase